MEIKTQTYVVTCERKDGTLGYLRTLPSSSTRTSQNCGLVPDAGQARQFDMDVDKQDILQWMDQERSKIAKWANLDSLKIAIYECTVTPIELDDHDWRVELQRSGVRKLSVLEIEALNLVKYELERRMAQD